MSRWRVGVDSGGTFTDICLFDEQTGRIEIWKVPSTPDDPSRGIAQGVEEGMRRVAPEAGERPAAPIVYFGHGTTVATNALIQHRGVKTGLITTDGFRDLLEIGRQKRPDLYDIQADKPLDPGAARPAPGGARAPAPHRRGRRRRSTRTTMRAAARALNAAGVQGGRRVASSTASSAPSTRSARWRSCARRCPTPSSRPATRSRRSSASTSGCRRWW